MTDQRLQEIRESLAGVNKLRYLAVVNDPSIQARLLNDGKDLLDEVDRLRKALHHCAAACGNPGGSDEACRVIIKIAKEALQGIRYDR